MRQRKIALMLVTLVLAGCGVWNDLFGSKQSASMQSSNCSRAALEVIIARAGMACSDTNPCPSGSYCNPSAVCAWSCYSDSECATGQVCGCDGRCTGSSSGADGGTSTTNLSCNKDATLLYKIKPGSSPVNIPPDACDSSGHCPLGAQCDTTSNTCTWVRACDNDERCPAGSYCDPATGNCSWDCQPNVACPDAAQSCDCTGRCIVPGSTPSAGDATCEPRTTINLALGPQTSFIEGAPSDPPSWTRTVSVSLSSPNPRLIWGFGLMTGSIMMPNTKTYVVPRDNLEVNCAGTWTSSPCPLPFTMVTEEGTTGWLVQDTGQAPGPVLTTAHIMVPFRAKAGVVAPSWHADVFTPGAGNSPQRLEFQHGTGGENIDPTGFPSFWFPSALTNGKGYQGSLSISSATDATNPAATPLRVDVKAVTQGDSLYIVDASRTITPSGTIQIGVTPDILQSYYYWRINNPRVFDFLHGLEAGTVTTDQVTGSLRGTLAVRALDLPSVVTADFALTPLPAGEPLPVPPVEPPTQPFEPDPIGDGNKWWPAYYDADFQLVSLGTSVSSFWIRGLYDGQRGVAAPTYVPKPPMVDGAGMLLSPTPNMGQSLCFNSFLGEYKAALTVTVPGFNTQLHSDVTFFAVDHADGDPIDSICQHTAVYSTQAQKDGWIPCVELKQTEDLIRDTTAGLSQTALCSGLRAQQFNSGNFINKTTEQWLAEDCHRAGDMTVRLLFPDNNTVAAQSQSAVWLCPGFANAYIRSPPSTGTSGFDESPDIVVGEPAFCYDPGRAGSPILWSGRFADGANADNTLEFSGDLLCQDEQNGTYAPKMFPLLTHADRVARGELFVSDDDSAATLLDACLTELHKPATAPLTDGTANGAAQAIFSNFSDAKCISMPRFSLALNRYSFPPMRLSFRDKQVYSHMLKQSIQVHSFVAHQGMEESRLRKLLASATNPSTSPVATSAADPGTLDPIHLDELLALVSESWQPIIEAFRRHPDFINGVLNQPDYRAWSGTLGVYSKYPERKAHQDQWVGLPAIMLEGVTQELRLLRAYLAETILAAYQPDPTAPNAVRDAALGIYSDTMRLTYLIEALAARSYGTFNSAFPPEWGDRWNTARDELSAVREDVRRVAAQLSRGGNPLGIEENDLPIFFGDPTGTNSRYFASSDYLVNQWAVPSVSTAQSALSLARDAWLQARNSRIQDRMTQTERERRVDDLKGQQGQKIIDNCGLTGIDAGDVLDALQGTGPNGASSIQLSTCFIDPACLPKARQNATDLVSKVTPSQIKFRLCTLNETAPYRNLPSPMSTCASDGSLNAGCTVSDLFNDFNTAQVPPDASRRAELDCQARLGFVAPLPGPRDLAGTMDPSCFRGKLGAAALQIVAASQDVDLARQNWDAAEQTFKLDAQYCEQVEASETDAINRANALNQALGEQASAKLVAQLQLDQIDAVGGWFSGVANVFSSPGSVVSGAVGLIEEDWKEKIQFAEDAMEGYQRNYNDAMEVKQANDNIRSCWHGVDKSNLAITSAFAQIARRGTDAVTASLQFKTLMNENVQALGEGTSSAKREQDRYVGTVAHHYWLSEKIDRFNKEFAWAKRMTYLAMRAVEYEFQQTLPLRQAVLTASHPDQLEDAIRTLQQEVGTRTINRRRPEESSIVLSLRDDVLALIDHSADPSGERQLTAARGLQNRLTDPRYGVNDKNGNWLGQGIPFNLGPEGALNYRCGERLWRITATVQGDALSDSQPGVSLMVLKRNTFASQWCEGEGDGSKFQYGSIQPSARLFSENGTGALESEANGFSTAFLYPWFNIRRTDFYKDTYRDGASEELAGRGLYGDYILLFPRDVLEGTANSTDACVSVKSGFPLDQVEDVLLRFDYLSVDNLPDLQQ